MSNSGTSSPPSTLPTITGNPGIDSLIRSALIAASVALTSIAITWANAHGFGDLHLTLLGTQLSLSDLIAGAVFTTFVTVVTVVWGYLKGTQVGQLVATAVQAGANLALSGNAILTTDHTGATVAAPFTPRTAKETITAYAPAVPSKT